MSSILIVDDEEDIRSFLRLVLESEGYLVRAAASAVEALQLIQKEKPQVILLDLMMPQVNGEELCRGIKNDPNFYDIHIVIVSARGDTATKVSCFDSGADEYLVKPVDAKELLARLRSYFRMLYRTRPPALPETSTREMKLPSDSAAELPRILPRYGHFRVESLVGSGASGHLLKGEDEQTERPVAIKVLSRALSGSSRFVERFRREAKVLAAAEHPGIATIYTFGEESGDSYIAMEWCPGGSLQDMINRKGRLELLSAVDILIQCIDALEAAFGKGILHRNIKPNNLMLDQNQRIKIVDFGLAMPDEVREQKSKQAGIFGTPDYMPPEQAQTGRIDHRADIYSLGIMFYQLMYGKLPFRSNSALEMIVKHTTEPFPEYDPLEGAVPREAYEIIEKMTRKAPDQRYQDYADCRRDLISLREEIFSSTGVLLPQVDNVAPAPIWKTEDYFEILSALYMSPHSGALTIRSGLQSLILLVQNRNILFRESQDAEGTIWNLLVEAGHVQKADIPPPGSDFRDSLMHFLISRAFGFEDLKKVYRHYLKTLVLDAGRWDPVECEFHAGEVHNDDLEGLFLGDALLDLAREVIPFHVVQGYFKEDRSFARAPESDHILTALSLTPEESFIASRIETEQGISMEELCLLTGFDEEKVMRLVYVLLRIGVCQWQAAAEKRRTAGRIEAQKEEPDSDPSKRIAEQFFELARREFDQGKYWKATELCKQAIRIDAKQAKYYHLMAMAFAHHPRFTDDADQCFHKAIDLEPNEAEYRLSHARFLIHQGQIQRAREEVDRVQEIDPENPTAAELRQELADQKS